MCTVTFFPLGEQSYILSTNRDELKSRKKALSPRLGIKKSTQFLRPIDGDKGGTWIAVNNFRLSLCIMNWYQAYENVSESKSYRTRGNIIHELIAADSVEDCSFLLSKMDLKDYQPFRLIGVQTDPLKINQWFWDSRKLEIIEEPAEKHLWISAGLEYEEVLKKREKVFQAYASKNGSTSLQDVKDLHSSQLPEPGKYAISMSGDIAQTVSNTIVYSRPRSVEMHYLNGFPATSDYWVTKKILLRNEMKTSR